jgi:transcription-repair coupling factor (superfamily II helicase)
MVRTLAIKAAVKRLDLAGNQLTLYFSAEHQQAPERLVDMILEHPERYQVKPNLVLTARLTGGALTAQLAQVKNILKEIEQRVNN